MYGLDMIASVATFEHFSNIDEIGDGWAIGHQDLGRSVNPKAT